jgi:hypothetical protein
MYYPYIYTNVLEPTDAAPLVGIIGPDESYLGLRSIGSMEAKRFIRHNIFLVVA